MFRHFLLGTIRQLARDRVYAVVTILGLAIGLASFLVTSSWLRFETSYDSDWANSERIARVIGTQSFAAGEQILAPLPYNLAPVLSSEFPEIEQAARIQAPSSLLFSSGDKQYYESSVFYADSNLLDILALPLKRGSRSTALLGPDKAVISSAIAEKYFGQSDPVGETLRLDNRVDLTVTAVMEPLPYNISFRPEIIVTMSTHAALAAGTYLHDWRTNAFGTFVLLGPGVDRRTLSDNMRDLLVKFRPDGTPPKLSLQPLTELHLTPKLQADFGPRRSKVILWMFGATALFVLIVAGVNYTNLATARALRRTKEVGVRKVLGADRRTLLSQFFSESFVVTGIAMIIAIALAELIVIGANSWFGANMHRYYSLNAVTLITMGVVWALTAVLSGLYPAICLASQRPAIAIRPLSRGLSRSTLVRSTLVILQFIISIALIIASITVYRQLDYFNSRDLGFGHEQIVTVPLAGQELHEKVPALKSALMSNPAVIAVTATGALPSSQQQSSASFNWEGGPPKEQLLFNLNVVDENYLETFGLTLAAGRNFIMTDTAAGSSMPCIINEMAAEKMGWTDAIGRNIIQPPDLKINVIGVVKNYNYASLHTPIRPLMLYMDPTRSTNLAVKISTNDFQATLSQLESLWLSVAPNRPFNYTFLDDAFVATYQAEQLAGKILLLYTVLAIVIASLGLISLASYRIAGRTKETGIRKVLGATVNSLVFMHLREFVIWIAIANLVAWPLGYFAMQKWLENFAYRVDVAWWTIALSGVSAMVIAVSTIAYQTVRAASENPVRSLRYE